MRTRLVAWTNFDAAAFEEETGFAADANTGSDLAEAAGRACYLSFGRPNSATATNAGYLLNIINQGHLSVLEHGTATFLFQEISRNVTHELIRHRHFSYSELSQRFVSEEKLTFVQHPTFRYVQGESVDLDGDVYDAGEDGRSRYRRILEKLEAMGFKGKKLREAARDVLPGMTETKIVVTGNYRAWRHFINKRGSEHADAAIREVALEVARILVEHAPNAFQDVEYYTTDNVWCVRTKVADEG